MDRSEYEMQVGAAKAGDKEAFCQLYETVYRKMYRVAFYALKNPQDAEDAVSEAVYDAFRKIHALRDASRFEGWIFAILASKIKRTMSGYYRRTLELSEEIAAEPLFDDRALDVKTGLALLPDEERLIVVLSAVCGYQSEEIGAIVGRPAGTVRSKLSRSLSKLREKLDA